MTRHSDENITESAVHQARVTISFLILSWLFILSRTWTRIFIVQSFGWDDSTMILAGLVFTVYSGSIFYIASNGGGTHIRDFDQLQLLTKWVVVSEATYLGAMMLVKISLGIFFARIIAKPWQIGLIYVNVAVNMFSTAASFFYCIFRCGSNIDNYVVQQLLDKCTPRNLDRLVVYQQATVTTLTDIVFVSIPVLLLWNANMSRRSKVSVGFILSLATLGVICSILRFRYVEGLTQVDDFFWNAVKITTWSTIECGACIVCGCLATLRPLLNRIASKARSSSVMKHVSRSHHSSNNNSLPHHTSHNKDTSTGQKSTDTNKEEPSTLAEFLARPGSDEAIAMREQEVPPSRIAQRTAQPHHQSNLWPVKSRSRKRQTIHASWTLRRGVASDGRTDPEPVGIIEPMV